MSTGAHPGADLAAGNDPAVGAHPAAGADPGPATEAMPAPAEAPPPPAPGEPGWLLGGRYRVIDRIGSGGMAEVFRAHDQLLARDVAVKVFRTHADSEDTGGVQRQELELQTLARLSHPNLITLFDGSIGSDGEPAFLVMELINGPSLAAQIAQAPLAEPEAREIATQIAGALAYVHAQQMVHRDIKPANILLGADGTDAAGGTLRARLSDFGIVRLLGSEHLTSADFMIGTASYLAPEQARGAEVGPAADVYALGLVLIEALTGRRSYQGPALEAVLARLNRSPEIPADLPQPWPELLAAMTAMEPELRPSAAEVARTLRDGSAVPTPMLAGAGSEVFPGLAAAAGGLGMAGVAAAGGVGVAGPALAGAAGPRTVHLGEAAVVNAGLAGALAGTAVPAGPLLDEAVDPDLPTALIGNPAAATDASQAPSDPPPSRRLGGRGPLAAAAALLVAAVATGGFLLVRQPAGSSPSLLPGQAATGGSSRPAAAKPTATPSSLAPVGSAPSYGDSSSLGTGPGRSGSASSSTGRTSASASSSAPATTSASAISTAPSTTSGTRSTAPPSSSAASASSSASESSSATASGTSSTSASPVVASSPAGSASSKKSGAPKTSG